MNEKQPGLGTNCLLTHVGTFSVLYENGGEIVFPYLLKRVLKGKIDKYQEEGLYFASAGEGHCVSKWKHRFTAEQSC